MKKILAVLLACAMFLPLLASCGTMQAGVVDVEAYPQEDVNYANVSGETQIGYIPTTGDAALRTELSDKVSKYSGSLSWSDYAWYLKETNVEPVVTQSPKKDSDTNEVVSYTTTISYIVTRKDAPETEDGVPVYTISTANEFMAFLQIRSAAIGGGIFTISKTTEKITVDGFEYDNAITTQYAFSTTETRSYHFTNIKVKLSSDIVISEVKAGVDKVDAKGDFKKAYKVPVIGTDHEFKGVFDGQGHVISGVYFESGVSGERGLFGPVQGDSATFTNFSVINSLFTTSTAKKSNQGFLVSKVLDGATVEFSNIYVDAYMVEPSAVAQTRVGGFVAYVDASQVAFENCIFAGGVNTPTSQYVGGFIGAIAVTASVEFNNCVNYGDVSPNAYGAGFVGGTSGTAKVVLKNCDNYGTIESNALYIGGFIGLVGSKSESAISYCRNYGDIKGTGNRRGGFVGDLSAGSFTVENSENHGSVSGGTHTGGLLGYFHGSSSVPLETIIVKNCLSTGAVTANRSSGGMIGYIQHARKVEISNCTVAAELNFTFIDTSNPYVGAIAGQLCDNGNVTVTGCVATGSLSATSTCKVAAYAGGLAGGIGNRANNGYFNLTNLKDLAEGEYCAYTTISDCVVSLDFNKVDYSEGNDKMEVFWSNNISAGDSRDGKTPTSKEIAHHLTISGLKYVTIDSDATNANAADATAIAKRTTKAVGYQTKDNGDGTTSLRYVFSVKGLSEVDKALGFDVSIEFKNGTTREIRVYCPTIYTSIKSGEDTIEAGEGEYLFTLVIENIPTEQIKVNGKNSYIKDALVTIQSFTAYNENARLYGVSKKVGDNTVYGYSHALNASNFNDGGAIYSELQNANVITVPFSQLDTVSGGAGQASANLLKWYDNGEEGAHCIKKLTPDTETGGVAHYYFQSPSDYFAKLTDFDATLQDAYMRLEFEVPADGEYQLYFHLRLKEGDTTRNVVFAIDEASVSEQHFMQYTLTKDESNAKRDGKYDEVTNPNGTNGTYMNTGICLNLTKGTHTIIFRMPQASNGIGIGSSSIHFRTLYLVPVAAN